MQEKRQESRAQAQAQEKDDVPPPPLLERLHCVSLALQSIRVPLPRRTGDGGVWQDKAACTLGQVGTAISQANHCSEIPVDDVELACSCQEHG
ncbi:hypothetical protein AAFF_G00129220 [Aldrovandia affinis]|uniref:Uncharacterized protein n=1 Tax=Aldrovandia affinis TaxID=143900 RepID=A0AAD7WWV9_9TELE|nr:hypothetical protein AAFF_G00129220 [Aldrovandia affinis]